jgi:hypothetical protein
MADYETIWSFDTARCNVICDVAPDYDLDLSWDDDGSTAAGLESGKYVAFVARVRVLIDGVEAGCDYLGGCIYESARQFIDPRDYFGDMVREAIRQARKFNSREPLRLR